MDQLKKIADILARSGVAIMTNAPGARPFPPILALRNAGVTVFSGNDNIRDSWWPYGDGDMLRRATTLGYRSGFNIDEELRVAFDVVTESGARALRLQGYGLRVGAKADFVTLQCGTCSRGRRRRSARRAPSTRKASLSLPTVRLSGSAPSYRATSVRFYR